MIDSLPFLLDLSIPLLILSFVIFFTDHKHRWKKFLIWGVLILSILNLSNSYFKGLFYSKHTKTYSASPKVGHDFFHYYFGGKYPELSYLDFYENMNAVLKDSSIYIKNYRNLRQLEQVLPTTEMDQITIMGQLQQDMGSERLEQLRYDLKFTNENKAPLQQIFLDHGFNGTPFWIFLQKLNPFTYGKLGMVKFFGLMSMDVVFFVLAILLLTICFRLTLLQSLLFAAISLNIEGFRWLIGSFSRIDWLLLMVLFCYFYNKKKFEWAGAMLAGAACIRIFPSVLILPFVFGALTKGPDQKTDRKVFMAFTTAAACFILLGGLVSNWYDWYKKIETMFGDKYLSLNNSSFHGMWVFLLNKLHIIREYRMHKFFTRIGMIVTITRLAILGLWLAHWKTRPKMEQVIFWLIMMPFLFSSIQNYYFVFYMIVLAYFMHKKSRMASILTLCLLIPYFGIDSNNKIDGFVFCSNYVLFALTYLSIELYRNRSRNPRPFRL